MIDPADGKPITILPYKFEALSFAEVGVRV